MTILLAPTFETAKTINAAATVEAEYGGNVVKGSRVTLAHHVQEYVHCPAPCSVKDVPVLVDDDTILVSHLDADSVGGCLALMGLKPESEEFWNAVAFVDVTGPHNAYQLTKHQQELLNALWAWNSSLPRVRYTEVTNVTQQVLDNVDIIQRIIDGDAELMEAGKKWQLETTEAVESRLVMENEKVRVFKTDGVFCSAAYYSANLGTVVPATIVLNTKFRAVTIAFEDGGKCHSAKDIVQELWGSEAGGHSGIAGSPRGWELSDEQLEAEFQRAIEVVSSL